MDLEKKLFYTFKNKSLLEEALRHSSYVNELAEASISDNQRLEFLGDAVLNLVISHMLMKQYPDLNEGDLTRMRACLVNESQLASIARKIDLGSFLQLGKGELQTQGREKTSLLADTLEAVIAAVYLDAGFESVNNMIDSHFSQLIDSVSVSDKLQDYKSKLQEYVQTTHKTIPTYRIIDEKGPDHDKTFCVQVNVSEISTQGFGKSKKLAQQEAAKKALEALQ